MSEKDGHQGWFWLLTLSQEQKDSCEVLLVAFPEHPGWLALVPVARLNLSRTGPRQGKHAKRAGRPGAATWRVHTSRSMANTIPPEIWPYMLPASLLLTAVKDVTNYATRVRDQ